MLGLMGTTPAAQAMLIDFASSLLDATLVHALKQECEEPWG